jgi:predicted DNA-binding transcriptional regulator YafY
MILRIILRWVCMNKLKLIDFLLMFTGKVNRYQLMEIACISIATASRALSEYRENHPENITYNIGKKYYEITASFTPVFKHEVESSLRTVAYGEIIESTVMSTTIGPSSFIKPDDNISINVASMISRSIFQKKCISLKHISSSSNKSETKTRLVYPHAIFESQNKWYVRALDFEADTYKNFKLVRIKTVEVDNKNTKAVKPDEDWNKYVIITISPHTNHPHPKALGQDLGIEDKPILNLKTTAALAGFLLSEWRVDSSKDAILDPYYFQYQLMNRYELTEIDSMIIAPGYNKVR